MIITIEICRMSKMLIYAVLHHECCALCVTLMVLGQFWWLRLWIYPDLTQAGWHLPILQEQTSHPNPNKFCLKPPRLTYTDRKKVGWYRLSHHNIGTMFYSHEGTSNLTLTCQNPRPIPLTQSHSPHVAQIWRRHRLVSNSARAFTMRTRR